MAKDYIKIEGEDLGYLIFLRLKRLQSKKICQKVIQKKLKLMQRSCNDSLLEKKSEDLASAIKSSLGFLKSNPESLNQWILDRYYGLMQLTIAEQLASPEEIDLQKIESYTKNGHGLKTIGNSDDPSSFLIYLTEQGYFSKYLAFLGCDVKPDYILTAKKADSDSNRHLMASLKELFARIPEIGNSVEEILGSPPYALHVGGNEFSGLCIYTKNIPEDFDDYEHPFKERQAGTELYENVTVCPSIIINKDNNWREQVDTYRSAFCGSSFIIPLKNGIKDIVGLHFMILYALSIIVRYYPSVWSKIESGHADDFRALIETYLSIFDRIIIKIMLERIEGIEIHEAPAGSLFSST